MQGRTHTAPNARPLPRANRSAALWIDPDHAILASTTPSGAIDVIELARVDDDETYLARVADRIGERERILIVGPEPTRIALEREYVTIYQRPDRIIDVEPTAPLGRAEVVERLRTLAAA